ncbi:hypothetical protein HN51_021399 [Arachis hypogaea]
MSISFIPGFLQERAIDAATTYVTRQLGYVWDYEKRFVDVSKAVEALKNDRDGVRDKAEEDEGRYGRAIYDNVVEWLACVDGILAEYEKFKQEHDDNGEYALAFPFQNLDIRYHRSKTAEDIKERVEELQNEKHDSISRWQGPPSSMGYALPSVEYEELDSRKQNMEDVRKALEDSSATMVGVHGLAGMGKTTLIIKAINTVQSREPKLFDMVIMANVGKNPDIRKIQGQIADMLGITLQEESEYARAIRIREKLKKGKNILIILDDMYAKVDLDALGILSQSEDDKKNLILKQGITKAETKNFVGGGPNLSRLKSGIDANRTKTEKKIEDTSSGSSKVGKVSQENKKRCKVLLISEAKRVLKQMDVNANSIIFLNIIKPDDAKTLFKKKVGITDEKISDLDERLAIDIAEKCQGLPMSIVTTAKALKNQSRSVWEETLKTLERQKFAGTPEYSTKLSYELLANEELKLIFLLCACMGQDALVSDLVRLCIGLGFLDVYTAKEARDQVQMLLIHLKESGLLSDGYSNDGFTMQNLVHNAALLIASENNVFVLAKKKLDEWPDDDKLKKYTAIFLHHCDVNTEFPKNLKCPKLKVFHFHNNHQHFKIRKDFFRGMKELRVLVLLGIDLSEMSSSMKYLTKLRKLCLEQCINLDENLCIDIGKFMKNLRILSFSGSDIKSLPTELKDLSKLQILDLSNCSQLKSIQAGVISSLTDLEELYMRNTLVEWRVDNNREENENKNASLSELGHLNQITNVDLQIPSVDHLPKNLFFDKLHSYKIVIGSSSTHLEPDFKIPEKYQLLRYLAILEKKVGIHSQKGIKMLFERVENLLLEELNGVQDIFYALNLKGFPCLKTLSIVSTSSIRYLIKPQERKHPENAFPKLETLHLYKLDNMKQLCSRVSLSSSSFCKLKVVKIKLCGLLKNVFLISMVKLLVALQTIEVSECNSLKEIVFAEDNAQDANASKSLELQELRTLTLKSLPEFHGFCSNSSTEQQKVLFNKQVKFSKLERLELCSIQITQIWDDKSPPFEKLVHLEVNGCDNLEENSNDTESEKKVTIFPNLKSIKVRSMKSLSGICDNEFELPKDSFEKLETMAIDECDKLLHVFTSNVVGIFQQVSNLSVTNCKSMKAIFDPAAWENKPAASKNATTKLQDVHFESLPKLEHMFNMKKKQLEGILKLNNLHKIWVQDCKRLENIFSAPVAKTLENNLEELVVSDCSQLRQIVAKKEEEDASSLTKLNFLKLATIKFFRLPKFKSFYPGAYGIEFSALNNLSIEQCDNLEPFREEEIIHEQTKPALFPETVMNNLKSIQIESRHATSSTNYDYRRDNLEELQLSGLKDTKILYSFLYSNPNMKNLCLNNGSFRELVPLERLAKIESLGVVPQLKSLKLTDLPNLENIGFERDPILQRIETLVFQNCPWLKTIAPSNVFFSHLTKLEVVDCKTLKYLMSPSTARSLGQLNTMKVNNCESVEEIVSEEGQEDHKDKDDIIFKQLTTIELASLKRLESFCRSKSCAFQFPSLEKFVVSACPELKSFSQQEHMKPPPKLGKVYVVHEKEKVEAYWTNNLQETIRDIFNKKIFFKGMEELSVSDHPHLQQLWQCKEERPPQGELFNNLKTLKLRGCEFKPYAIPSNVLFSFKNLKELEVDRCEKITGIFEMNDEIKETSFQLKKLTLKWLPNVTHVWNPEKKGILSFKSLEIVNVYRCKDLRTLFPIALAKDLMKLEELDVRTCGELPNIVEAEEGGTVDEDLVFPCLTTLELCYLPNLTGFCSQKFTLECPELNRLEVYDCNDQLFQSQPEENQNSTSTAKQPLFMNIKDISKMEYLALNWRYTQALSSWLTELNNKNLESLNELYLVDDDGKSTCNVPVGLFEKTPNLETLGLSFSCDEILKNILPSHDNVNNKEILGNLKELYLSNLDKLKTISGVEYLLNKMRLLYVSACPKLTTIVLQSCSFLKELHIQFCDAMLRLFTSSTAKMLIHLEELRVGFCKSLKEIVGEEQQSATEDEAIEFKQLQRITLRSLESLECFYSGNATLKFPSLIQLDRVDCSKMKVFSHGNVPPISRRIQVSYNDSSDDLVFLRDLNNAAVVVLLVQSLSEGCLDLGDHSELKDLWLDKVHITDEAFFSGFNLESLVVEDCDEFFTTAILPSHLLPFLGTLQVLEVRECSSVEAIFEVKDTPSDIVIPLKILALEKLPNLRHVWNKDSEGKLSLPKLEEVIIDECASIKSVFPESVGKGNIQRLEVKNCAELDEIVAGDDVAKQVSIFSTLSYLKLWNLPNLKCPLLLSHLLPSLHKLEELVVGNCGSLKTIFDVKDAPTNEEDTNMITVIPLKKLTLEKLPTLSHVWKGKLSLPKLEKVIVDKCASLKSLFLESVNIQRLEVKNCEKLVEIVTRNELAKEDADKQVNIFSKLSCLKLWNLPNLSNIYHGMEDSEFSLSNALLPWHMLPSLHKLEELVVGNCGSFETIFDVKDTDIISVEAIFEVKDTIIDIPLKKLTLGHLPTLSHIWNKDPKGSSLSFLCLEEVVVNGCKSLTSLLPASLPMSNMKKINVKNCEKLVEIVTKDEADNKETNKELTMFLKLTSLTLHNLPNLTYICAGMEILNLPKLRELDISHCKFGKDSTAKVVTPHLQRRSIDMEGVMMVYLDSENIKYVRLQGFNDIHDSDAASAFNFFPKKVPLPNIQMLVVVDSVFKNIFPSKKPEIIHSQLLVRELELRNLHKLESIGLQHTWVASSNLTSLKVEGCASLKYLFTSSAAKCLVQLEELHISNCEELESLMLDYQPHDDDHDVIIFEKLKKLSLSQIPKLESFYKGNSTLKFPSLEKAEVTECNRLEYMFTFSTAKSLQSLSVMQISKCESLETVVLATQKADEPHELTFPNLEFLFLSELPKLGSFFTGKSTLKFPSYGFQVYISQCKIMKTFSHGDVEAPKLWMVEIDGVCCSKDNLNAAVSQQFEKRSSQH